MTTAIKVTLGEFGPNRIFYTSVGRPAGETLEIDPFDTSLDDREWWSLEGTVDADGIWRWDGEGNPTDFNRNTVMRVDAWVDGEEKSKIRTVRATWVERGTRNWNPAGPDDRTFESDESLEEIRQHAEEIAEYQGYDLDRYECRVEEIA